MVFLGVFWGFLEFWSGWRVLAQKIGPLVKFDNFSGIVGEFSWYLEWLGPNVNIFQKPRVIRKFFQMHGDHGKIYKKLRGLNAKWSGIMDFPNFFYNGKFSGPGP
jgi:hypothetical protein